MREQTRRKILIYSSTVLADGGRRSLVDEFYDRGGDGLS
jgi:hypothetical protein